MEFARDKPPKRELARWRDLLFLTRSSVEMYFLNGEVQCDRGGGEECTADLRADIQASKSGVLRHLIWNVALLESTWISLRASIQL